MWLGNWNPLHADHPSWAIVLRSIFMARLSSTRAFVIGRIARVVGSNPTLVIMPVIFFSQDSGESTEYAVLLTHIGVWVKTKN